MAKKKAKWLEEATLSELVQVVKAAVIDEDEKAGKKLEKAIEELVERTAVTETEGTLSVEDAIATLTEQFTAGIEAITTAYNEEAEAMATGIEPSDEDEEDDTDEDEDDADDSEGEDYTEYSQKELKAMCKDRGLKVNKSMKKVDFIKMLEADDAE